MTAPPPWRRFVLLLHITTSVGFVGAVAAFSSLAIGGAVVGNEQIVRALYVASGVVTWTVIVPLAWLSLGIGLLQSLITSWGIVRHYWVAIKLVLSVVTVAVLMLQTRNVDWVSEAALGGQIAGLAGPRAALIVHAIGGFAVLGVMIVLSVYKPRGMTTYGIRRLAEERIDAADNA